MYPLPSTTEIHSLGCFTQTVYHSGTTITHFGDYDYDDHEDYELNLLQLSTTNFRGTVLTSPQAE
ncbi:20353_t:CDS:2 [Gigaspora margarita]|uniref:20353_t:CDS:1 n=1 Tax=Gigaspora margarita TaxID=4874 RepID=A0ABM8W100_GIGMA|nr:20353_t:CDS:2 [Gigaspora margarita]